MKPIGDLESKMVMKIGELKHDMISAQEVVKESGIDVTSPIAPIVIQMVLNEIRQIRSSLENPIVPFPFIISPIKAEIEEPKKGE